MRRAVVGRRQARDRGPARVHGRRGTAKRAVGPDRRGLVRLGSDASGDLPWRFTEEPGERYLEDVNAGHGSDESLATTYRVPDVVPAGTYRAWGLFEAEWMRATDGRRFPRPPYPFLVRIQVT